MNGNKHWYKTMSINRTQVCYLNEQWKHFFISVGTNAAISDKNKTLFTEKTILVNTIYNQMG